MKMPAYEKHSAALCGDCANFRRHYVRMEENRYDPLAYGHCVFPRLKARTADQTCRHWRPKPP